MWHLLEDMINTNKGEGKSSKKLDVYSFSGVQIKESFKYSYFQYLGWDEIHDKCIILPVHWRIIVSSSISSTANFFEFGISRLHLTCQCDKNYSMPMFDIDITTCLMVRACIDVS